LPLKIPAVGETRDSSPMSFYNKPEWFQHLYGTQKSVNRLVSVTLPCDPQLIVRTSGLRCDIRTSCPMKNTRGLVHPKMKILSSINNPCVVPNS